jgi:hypothetical protein
MLSTDHHSPLNSGTSARPLPAWPLWLNAAPTGSHGHVDDGSLSSSAVQVTCMHTSM